MGCSSHRNDAAQVLENLLTYTQDPFFSRAVYEQVYETDERVDIRASTIRVTIQDFFVAMSAITPAAQVCAEEGCILGNTNFIFGEF